MKERERREKKEFAMCVEARFREYSLCLFDSVYSWVARGG